MFRKVAPILAILAFGFGVVYKTIRDEGWGAMPGVLGWIVGGGSVLLAVFAANSFLAEREGDNARKLIASYYPDAVLAVVNRTPAAAKWLRSRSEQSLPTDPLIVMANRNEGVSSWGAGKSPVRLLDVSSSDVIGIKGYVDSAGGLNSRMLRVEKDGEEVDFLMAGAGLLSSKSLSPSDLDDLARRMTLAATSVDR